MTRQTLSLMLSTQASNVAEVSASLTTGLSKRLYMLRLNTDILKRLYMLRLRRGVWQCGATQ